MYNNNYMFILYLLLLFYGFELIGWFMVGKFIGMQKSSEWYQS